MDLTGAPAPCPTGSSLLEDSVKYLIVEDFSGQPVPFLFPRRVDHADMFEQLPYGKVLAAGYAELGPDGFVCYGGNAELGAKARPQEDPKIIAESLRVRPDRCKFE